MVGLFEITRRKKSGATGSRIAVIAAENKRLAIERLRRKGKLKGIKQVRIFPVTILGKKIRVVRQRGRPLSVTRVKSIRRKRT